MPTRDYAFTGGWQHFDIPNKVEWVDVVLEGAGSNDTPGGQVTGKIRVKGKNKLSILVGEQGSRSGGQTVGGGGAAGTGDLGDGWSGGGATVLRMNTTTGAIRGVAAGAGGGSGDKGPGGKGGGLVGEAGHVGTPAEPGDVGVATGGTQIQGGVGGTSSVDPDLNGSDAGDRALAHGGRGGTSGLVGVYGGGGGGGGYRAGGGGSAGLAGQHNGTGGGGGSDYDGGLTGPQTTQGGGRKGHGRASVSWVTPAPANQPPTPPTEVKVGGTDYTESMSTMSKGKVRVTAKVNDPNSAKVRMVVYYSPDPKFRQHKVISSTQVDRGKRAEVKLEGLTPNTLWYLRLYSRDPTGLLSTSYTSVKFWTDRPPGMPVQTLPSEDATLDALDTVVFGWKFNDPDEPTSPHQRAFNLQWRRAGTAVTKAGDWKEVTFRTSQETFVGDRGEFKSNTYYEWRVRTKDDQNTWGLFSTIWSFYIQGDTTPPWATSPVNGEALDLADDVTFTWDFRDPDELAAQLTADLQYRLVGSDLWIGVPGDDLTPGPVPSWTLPASTLPTGHWEWQVRTTSSVLSLPSQWSDAQDFYIVRTPGDQDEAVVPTIVSANERLGSGTNEVHVYRRGGQVYVGKITPVETLQYTRKRDDMGNCLISTNGVGDDGGALLRDIHCWTHEIVIYRDGERTWEGPITRITDQPGSFQIEAKDVMAYPYRRIMRQGYNDTYRLVNNTQVGQRTVVQRAKLILMNALAPDDPNILPYLTTLDYADDALESRTVADYAKMSWEEVDSLAATGGLDYAVLGRRIILNDTHRPVGRLPELRTEHFSDPPVISEYGMLLATDYAVTNNNGVYAVATKRKEGEVGPYGLVEQLVSAFGETQDTAAPEALTPEQIANLQRTLQVQAELGIASRWPTPLVVRVPDNSTLIPDTPVKLAWLVPGVWVPLRAQGTVREIAQWQKIDVVTVTQDKDGEKVALTLSPAPNGGDDPDADPVVDDGS